MLYLIGGAPRCGKTKLAKKLSKKLNIPVFSTDKLRVDILKKIPQDQVDLKFPFEKMFNGDRVDECFRNHKPIDFLNADKREARTLFNDVKSLVANKNNLNYIIEGVHLLPVYMNKLFDSNSEFRIIYLGKTNEIEILRGLNLNRDKNDWIIGHIKHDITFKRASKMVREYGQYFEKEAEKFGYKYINTESNFFDRLNIACDELMS